VERGAASAGRRGAAGFVSNLRRTLEPDRAPRSPARLLGDGGRLLAERRPDEAQACPDAALEMWRGEAYADFADEKLERQLLNQAPELDWSPPRESSKAVGAQPAGPAQRAPSPLHRRLRATGRSVALPPSRRCWPLRARRWPVASGSQ
jgi:hypothetical protein